VLAPAWNQLRSLEWSEHGRLLSRPRVVDQRNLYEPERMAAAGFRYVSVGRREGKPPEVMA
jgi:UDPglucose 6-dehydrogenase